MKGASDYDFILSFVIFLGIYLTIFNTIPFLTISSVEETDILTMESNYLSEILVKSPGYPHVWNVSNVSKLGLVYYNETYAPNILDYNKLVEINNTDCNNLISKTDTTIKFNVKVETEDYTLNCSNTIADNYRLIERLVTVYDGYYKPGKLSLYTWS